MRKWIRNSIVAGDMPPFYYTIAHPEARLGPKERRRRIEGLSAAASRLTR